MENGCAGQVCFAETVTKHAPGEARPPRALLTFPTVRPGSASTCPKGSSALKSDRQRRVRRGASPARAGTPPPAPPERIDLFAPARTDDPDAADPATLARAATLASGRAMKGRLWNEAKALAGLAESYARLTDRSKRRELTVETMDLKLLFEAMHCDQEIIRERFWVNGDEDPDRAVKQAYWEHRRQMMTAARETQTALMRRVWEAERIAQEAGGTIELSEAGRAAEEETSRWAELTDEEIAEEGDGAASGREGEAADETSTAS